MPSTFSNRIVQAALSRFCNLLLASLALYAMPFVAQAQTATFTGSQAVVYASPALTPYGVALDAAGDLFIADAQNNQVLKVPATGGQPTTVGTGLNFPTSVAVDKAGDVYIADSRNNRVVEVQTAVGIPLIELPIGSGFKSPSAVAVDASGNVFIADTGNNRVVEVVGGLKQTTLAAGFNGPDDVALDGFGNLYVADSGNNRVAMLPWTGKSFGGVKTAVSGVASPTGIAFDASSNLYITEEKGSQVLESALGGLGGGYETPMALATGFLDARALAVSPEGVIYIGDTGTQDILTFVPPGPAVNFGSANLCPAGQTQPAPCSKTVTLNFQITGLGNDTAGFIALTLGAKNLDFKLDSPATTCTANGTGTSCSASVVFSPLYAGPRPGAVQVMNSVRGTLLNTVLIQGTGEGAQIAYPFGPPIPWAAGSDRPNGVAVDGAGNLYIADGTCQGGSACVYEIPAGIKPLFPITLGADSVIQNPYGVAVDGAGDLYIVDSESTTVTKVFAGGGTFPIHSPFQANNIAIAVDAAGNVFVGADCEGAPAGSTLWEIPGGDGSPVTLNPVVDGLSVTCPTGIAVDFAGNLYVADFGNNRVIEVPANGTAPVAIGSGFSEPFGVAVDGAGNVFVADNGNDRVAEILAGSNDVITVATASTLPSPPRAITVDEEGDLYVTGWSALLTGSFVMEFPRSQPPTIIASTAIVNISKTGWVPIRWAFPQTAVIQNIGNQPLIFPSKPSYPAHFYENTADTSLCASGVPVEQGASCDISVSISEAVTGKFSGNVVLTDNAYGQGNGTQKIPVSGNAIEAPFMSWPTPGPMTLGEPLTAAQLNAKVSLGIAGTFTYDPPAGTVLSAGTHTLKATFIPANLQQYAPNTATVTVVVRQPLMLQTATPTISPAAGEYVTTQWVTMADATPGAQIYYTYDGTTPTISSLLYTEPLATSETQLIRAIAIAPDHTVSQVASANYTFPF